MKKSIIPRSLCKVFNNVQFIKYLVAGVISNGVGYCFYLIATMVIGFGPKIAMTGLYVLGVVANFFINRRWTFHATNSIAGSMLRFLLVIVVGYLINLLTLYVCVDLLSWPHQMVQAGAIAAMTFYFFSANKWYVHKSNINLASNL